MDRPSSNQDLLVTQVKNIPICLCTCILYGSMLRRHDDGCSFVNEINRKSCQYCLYWASAQRLQLQSGLHCAWCCTNILKDVPGPKEFTVYLDRANKGSPCFTDEEQ